VVLEPTRLDSDVSPSASTGGVGRGPSVTKASQDWVRESATVKTKSPTSDKRWEGPGLISGGAARPIRLISWGEGNGPVTGGIRANPNPTPISRQALQRVG